MVEAVTTNNSALIITKASALRGEICPEGISREAVRGFSASILRSAQRLKPIATLRAKTIQSTTCNKSHHEKVTSVLHNAYANDINAKGIAKMVCENFTSRRYFAICSIILLERFYTFGIFRPICSVLVVLNRTARNIEYATIGIVAKGVCVEQFRWGVSLDGNAF